LTLASLGHCGVGHASQLIAFVWPNSGSWLVMMPCQTMLDRSKGRMSCEFSMLSFSITTCKEPFSVSNLLSTLYYRYEYRKDIHEKPADCALIHVIDDVILFVLKEQAISLRLSVVSFMLRRLGT